MQSEVFEIYEVSGFESGTLALCRQPATDADFAMISAWAPSVVVTLTGEDEFPKAGTSLPRQFLKAPYDWLHLPITDFGIPPKTDCDLWQDTLGQLQGILATNGRALVHCKGGQGRSGMLLLKLLTLQGENGEEALKRIRAVRAGAVETEDQYIWAIKPL